MSSNVSTRVEGDSLKVELMQNTETTTDGRETWGKKIEFLLAVIGFAVDLGNVWRFPYICYKNGGGAFLVPYLLMFIFGGLPLFYLELALGQYHRSGCLTVWNKICPMMKGETYQRLLFTVFPRKQRHAGLGYAICIIDLYMAMYYNTVIAWAVYYLFASFRSELPWTSCDNPWNTRSCRSITSNRSTWDEEILNGTKTSPAQEYFERSVLQIHQSSGIDDLGPIKLSLSLCLFAVFLLVYFSLWKGVKSTGKAVWITAIAPYIVLFILLIRGLTLPGSEDGILYYLKPQWDKLNDKTVWIDAATQIFFSLGPGFGTLLALSSPGLVFIVYPEAIATMDGSVFWSITFFFMLITLGLDSTFGGLEALITGMCDEYPLTLGKHREIFVGALVVFIYICALPTTTYGGNYVLQLLDAYGPSMSILFVVFVEAVTVCWLYGTKRFSDDVQRMLGFRPGLFWIISWNFISPLFIFFIFVTAMVFYEDLTIENYIYPPWAIAVGWVMTMSSLMWIPIYIIYYVIATPGSFKQVKHVLKTNLKWS
uniref:Transporter n=1 Tax=Strigamia maritima TaxID=126957 RepID=T1J2K8_STRMM